MKKEVIKQAVDQYLPELVKDNRMKYMILQNREWKR